MTKPSDATHEWLANTSYSGYGMQIVQLHYYKRVGYCWFVYSEITGWRPSKNPDAWFEKEMRQGYFVEISK